MEKKFEIFWVRNVYTLELRVLDPPQSTIIFKGNPYSDGDANL